MKRILFVAGSLFLLIFIFFLRYFIVQVRPINTDQFIFSCGFCFPGDFRKAIERTCKQNEYIILERRLAGELKLERQLLVSCKETY